MDEILLIPVGENHNNFNGIITTNEIGKFIFEHLEQAKDEEDLDKMVEAEYDGDPQVIRRDIHLVLNQFKKSKII